MTTGCDVPTLTLPSRNKKLKMFGNSCAWYKAFVPPLHNLHMSLLRSVYCCSAYNFARNTAQLKTRNKQCNVLSFQLLKMRQTLRQWTAETSRVERRVVETNAARRVNLAPRTTSLALREAASLVLLPTPWAGKHQREYSLGKLWSRVGDVAQLVRALVSYAAIDLAVQLLAPCVLKQVLAVRLRTPYWAKRRESAVLWQILDIFPLCRIFITYMLPRLFPSVVCMFVLCTCSPRNSLIV